MLFQKSLKYGLPDSQSISYYESGFSDRFLAQEIREAVNNKIFEEKVLSSTKIKFHIELIQSILKDYPRYFESVLALKM